MQTSPEIQSSVVGGVTNKPHPLPHSFKFNYSRSQNKVPVAYGET